MEGAVGDRVRVSVRRSLVLAAVAAATSVGAAVPAGASPASAPIDSLLIQASAVGKGLTRSTYEGGRSLSRSTVGGLCAYRSVTDALRTRRVQVRFVPQHALKTQALLSQEVAIYVPHGAGAALDEVRALERLCTKKTTIYFGKANHKGSEQLTPFTIPGLPDAVAMSDHLVRPKYDGVPAADRHDVFIYQVHGDTMTAIYAFGRGTATLASLTALASRAATAAHAKLLAHA